MTLAARFRKQSAMDRYLAAYEDTLALWPVPPETLDVKTSFGTTHINVAGPSDAPPLILIHGAQISSTVWYANVGPLSQHFRVYAPDVIDQAGRSVPTRKLTTREDCANWLCELLDVLGIDSAPIVGHSQGCWQILNLAMLNPERIEKMILLSPAGFTRLRIEMFLRVLPVFFMPTKRMFYWSLGWMRSVPMDVNHPFPVIDQFILAATSYKGQELGLGVVYVFDDKDLQAISTPTLLLIGEDEKIVHPKKVMERSQRLIPNIKAEIIDNAGHFMPVDQADVVNAKMLEFLKV